MMNNSVGVLMISPLEQQKVKIELRFGKISGLKRAESYKAESGMK
jgi:hypothetical protein